MPIKKFSKEYVVKSYEADCHGFLRLLTLMNLLQDVADENACTLKLGIDECRKMGLAWVGSNYLLNICRLPKIHEHFVVETWPAEIKLWGVVRDFVLRDLNGNLLVRASSQWVLIDYKRKRPVLLNKYFPNFEALNERAIKTNFPKMVAPTDNLNETELKVRFDDIDVNNHVNNAIYPLWATESLPTEFRLNNVPEEIEIQFKKEALYGENIVVFTQINNNETRHAICESNKDTELALCRIKWKKITSE